MRFIPRLNPPLRRYLEYAFQRSARVDFLRAVEADGPPIDEKLLTKEHYVWETGVWLCASGRKLVRRAEGTHRILPAADVLATDRVLPNELHPCEVKVRDDGIYEFRETVQSSNVQVYYRGDPRANETALQEALPHCSSRSKAILGSRRHPRRRPIYRASSRRLPRPAPI